VELISERADLDLASLLHQRAFLAFSPNGDGIQGIVHHGESGKRMTHYRLAIVPQLASLLHRTNQPEKRIDLFFMAIAKIEL
jgi:type VI secretion system secreted protein VgrG